MCVCLSMCDERIYKCLCVYEFCVVCVCVCAYVFMCLCVCVVYVWLRLFMLLLRRRGSGGGGVRKTRLAPHLRSFSDAQHLSHNFSSPPLVLSPHFPPFASYPLFCHKCKLV